MMNKYHTMIEHSGEQKSLHLSSNNIGDDDMKTLAEALRNTEIERLSLSNNNIGCNGLKYLADVLKDTRIKDLELNNNKLRDEGVKYLADVLNSSKIQQLELTGNKITFEAAEYLNVLKIDTPINRLHLDVYKSETSDIYVSQRAYSDGVTIKLKSSNIGIAGSKYINNSFGQTGIGAVEFDFTDCNHGHLDNLFEAFRNIKISKLQLSRSNHIEYLLYVFEESEVGQIHLFNFKLNFYAINNLAHILKKKKIFGLDVSTTYLDDSIMRSLAPALKNSDVMYLNLGKTRLTSQGISYLSEILRDSKIVHIGLCNSRIGTDGAIKLANGLPHSQVTDMHLHGNQIGLAGYKALIGIIEDTNVSWVNLHHNGLEEELYDKYSPYKIPRTTTTVAFKIENAFKGLVSLDPNTNEFEFTVPKKDCDPSMINQYAFLIKTLKNDPNSKVHIIYNTCQSGDVYDFDKIDKIDDFVSNITDKFLSFIESNIPALLDEFNNDDCVDLVRQFEEMGLSDIVQNLLLHRILYYVDENQVILHPYIYKLLNKYHLPVYNSELEPNKKDEIISYFESHLEIDGAQEIIDLLKSNSF